MAVLGAVRFVGVQRLTEAMPINTVSSQSYASLCKSVRVARKDFESAFPRIVLHFVLQMMGSRRESKADETAKSVIPE